MFLLGNGENLELKKARFKEAVFSFLKSGNIFLLIVGMLFSVRLNNLFLTPYTVILLGLRPFSIYTLQSLIIPLCIVLFPCLLVWKFCKNPNYVWFFAGASIISFWFAMGSLFEIALYWYIHNVGRTFLKYTWKTQCPQFIHIPFV